MPIESECARARDLATTSTTTKTIPAKNSRPKRKKPFVSAGKTTDRLEQCTDIHIKRCEKEAEYRTTLNVAICDA